MKCYHNHNPDDCGTKERIILIKTFLVNFVKKKVLKRKSTTPGRCSAFWVCAVLLVIYMAYLRMVLSGDSYALITALRASSSVSN